jgi:hypothetical protein
MYMVKRIILKLTILNDKARLSSEGLFKLRLLSQKRLLIAMRTPQSLV